MEQIPAGSLPSTTSAADARFDCLLLRSSKGVDDPYTKLLHQHGFPTHCIPALELQTIQTNKFVVQILCHPDSYSGCVVTSAQGVRSLRQGLESEKLAPDLARAWREEKPLYVLGPATAKAASKGPKGFLNVKLEKTRQASIVTGTTVSPDGTKPKTQNAQSLARFIAEEMRCASPKSRDSYSSCPEASKHFSGAHKNHSVRNADCTNGVRPDKSGVVSDHAITGYIQEESPHQNAASQRPLLLVVGNKRRPELPDGLRRYGVTFQEWVAYENRPHPGLRQALEGFLRQLNMEEQKNPLALQLLPSPAEYTIATVKSTSQSMPPSPSTMVSSTGTLSTSTIMTKTTATSNSMGLAALCSTQTTRKSSRPTYSTIAPVRRLIICFYSPSGVSALLQSVQETNVTQSSGSTVVDALPQDFSLPSSPDKPSADFAPSPPAPKRSAHADKSSHAIYSSPSKYCQPMPSSTVTTRSACTESMTHKGSLRTSSVAARASCVQSHCKTSLSRSKTSLFQHISPVATQFKTHFIAIGSTTGSFMATRGLVPDLSLIHI